MSNIPSNIPFTDINAGHTISEMVDIINTNFDLVNLKGGGPEGIQGIQGVLGFSGPQGTQGIQGKHGNGWVTSENLDEAEAGDLYLTPEGVVQTYDGTSFQDVYNLTDELVSPFTHTGANIHPKNEFLNGTLVLGGTTPSTNTMLNIIGSQPSLALSTGAVNAEMKIGENNFQISSNNVLISSNGGASIGVKSGNIVNISPLADMTTNNEIHPFVTADNEGNIKHEEWKWGIRNNCVISNENLSNCYVGDDEHAIDGVWIKPDGNINFQNETGKYLKINSKNTGETTLKNVIKLNEKGISVGSYSNNDDFNFDPNNKGVYISGGSNRTCGHLTFVGSTSFEKYVNYDSALTPGGSGQNSVVVPSYLLDINNIQNNSIKDNSPLITIVPKIKNYFANTLHIKGGTYMGKGYDVLINGGDGIGEANNSTNTGGDVYIAGGENKSTGGGNNEIIGSLYNFGDVIIGVNPNNHPLLRTDANTSASSRAVSKDNANLSYFDICNFTAHANIITLDSDANNRMVYGYPNDGTSPKLTSIKQSTFKLNGLLTLCQNDVIRLNKKDAFTYQMLSGVYSFACMYYINNGTFKTKKDTSLHNLLTSNEYTSLAGGTTMGENIKFKTVFSTTTTNWQKIGNVVNCQTRIDFYYVCNANNELSILTPIKYRIGLNIFDPNTYAYDRIITDGILTNVELPLCLYDSNTINILRPNYVSGNGCAYTEKVILEDLETIGKAQATADPYFLNNVQVSVNNNTSYTNPVLVNKYSMVETINNSTNKHDNSGILNDNVVNNENTNMPRGYLWTDPIINDTQTLLVPKTRSTYIIPEYMDSVTVENSSSQRKGEYRKFVSLKKPYTSLTLNYSYLLNTGFEKNQHNDFIYVDGTSSNLIVNNSYNHQYDSDIISI